MFSSVRYLGGQGQAFRGHEERDGGYASLVIERAENDYGDEVKAFLAKRDNWLSPVIQNEMIEIFGRAILKDIMNEVEKSDFVGLVADATTDISCVEQLSICLQYVSKEEMTVTNSFVGMYEAPSTTGEVLAKILRDVLTRMCVNPMTKLSGFSFDGAANMSGAHRGVKARLQEDVPTALHVPCTNHSLDLVLQEASREVALVADCIQLVKDIANVINDSAKRGNMFRSMFGNNEAVRKLLGVCATRWCVRATAMERLIEQYPKAKQALENLQDDRGISGDMRAKISGLCRKMGKARTYIAMQLIVGIIRPCELAAKALQGSNMTAMASLSCIQLLRTQLEKTRNGGLLTELKEATHQAEGLGLTVQQPRKTKTPARVRHTDASAVDEVRDPFQEVRIATLEALDLMMSALDHRFDTAGLKLAARREEVLLKIICEHQSTSEIAKHLQELKLPPTIDIETLKTQLSVFAGAFTETPKSTKDVAECLGKMDAVGRIMVPEVTKFISLILSVPCSVASAERSFSMLRRLKNYLRNSMGQARLTHLALMAAHKEKLRAMDMRQLMREFVKKTPERRLRFGNV